MKAVMQTAVAQWILWCSTLWAAGQGLSQNEIHDLFSQAKEAFRQGNEVAQTDPDLAHDLYAKAALRYERLVKDGAIENGQLYYNIGNAYFLMGDMGRAILNYRRAKQYIPNDPNLLQNLEQARKQRLDKFSDAQQTRVLKTLFFWHYDLSSRIRFWSFAVFFAAFWLIAALRLFFKRPGLAWIGGITAVVWVSLLASLMAETIQQQTHTPGVITAHEVVARKGDSEAYEPSFKAPLHAGTEFSLMEQRGDWMHVQLPDGRQCWLPAQAAQTVR